MPELIFGALLLYFLFSGKFVELGSLLFVYVLAFIGIVIFLGLPQPFGLILGIVYFSWFYGKAWGRK